MLRYFNVAPKDITSEQATASKLIAIQPSIILCCFIYHSILYLSQVNILTKRPLRKERIDLLQSDTKEKQTLIHLNYRQNSLIGTKTNDFILKFYSTSTLQIAFEIDMRVFDNTSELSYCSSNNQVLVWSSERVMFWELYRRHLAGSIDFPRNVSEDFSEMSNQGRVLFQTQDHLQIFVVNTNRRELEQILDLNLPRMTSGPDFNDCFFFIENIQFFETRIWELSCFRLTNRLELVFRELIGYSEESFSINALKYNNAILASDSTNTIVVKKAHTKIPEVRTLNTGFPCNIAATVELANGNLVVALDKKSQVWLWMAHRKK